MCLSAILGIGATLIGANAQRQAADQSAQTIRDSSAEQIAMQDRQYQQTRADMLAAEDRNRNALLEAENRNRAALSPYTTAGATAQNALAYETGIGAKPMDYAGYTATPGYDFRLREGQKAIEASAAKRGGLFSGAVMQSLQRDSQDYATADYGNYLARLSGLAGNGQNAAAGIGAAGMNTASSIGGTGVQNALNLGNLAGNNTATQAGLMSDAANASANARVVGANALTGAIGNGLSLFNYQRNLNPQNRANGNGAFFDPMFGGKGLFGGNSWG